MLFKGQSFEAQNSCLELITSLMIVVLTEGSSESAGPIFDLQNNAASVNATAASAVIHLIRWW